MSEARYFVGDVFDRLREIPDGSIDLIVSSPPFLALRSYLPASHPLKGKEIGSEPTPAAFLSTLLTLTAEWRRVLAPHGSLCVELGDTYSGSGGAGGDYLPGGLREGQPGFGGSAERQRDGNAAHWRQKNAERTAWPLDKSLCLLPTLYPASLAYGRNLLTGQPCQPWRVRNLVVWHRPNPPVGALGDKVRPSTSYVTVACTARNRWFDLDAERGAPSANTHARTAKGVLSRPNDVKVSSDGNRASLDIVGETAGAPPLNCWFDDRDQDGDNVWTIPTQPFRGAHYATFPVKLPRRLINLMCPRQVCTQCGEPRRRIVGRTEEYAAARAAIGDFNQRDRESGSLSGSRSVLVKAAGKDITCAENVTLGWSDCDHGDTWRRGVVLDPFCGSGTTLVAAAELGRDSIGIDLDARNLDLARQRLGMFLVEDEVSA